MRHVQPRISVTGAGFLAISLAVMTPAFASSDDAWKEMRDKLRQGCLAKAKTLGLGQVAVAIDPFGSENYALALLTRRATAEGASVASVCIMDKATGRIEIGGEIPLK